MRKNLSQNSVLEKENTFKNGLLIIQNAEDNLKDFFDNQDYEELVINKGLTQRIILIAANFRKEVTSTILWLMNYKLKIQCFKVTPYQLDDKLFLNFEQIIPMKDSEEYVINMAEKTHEDINIQEESKSRYNTRIDFWKKLLPLINKRTDLFKNISPSKDNWIGAGTGISSTTFNFVMSRNYARVELYLSRGIKEENKLIFDELFKYKEEIEEVLGANLIWERLDDKKASRIKYQKDDVNVFNELDWPNMIAFMVDSMVRFEKAFKKPLIEVRKLLIAKIKSEDV